jgi:hypothetical protein
MPRPTRNGPKIGSRRNRRPTYSAAPGDRFRPLPKSMCVEARACGDRSAGACHGTYHGPYDARPDQHTTDRPGVGPLTAAGHSRCLRNSSSTSRQMPPGVCRALCAASAPPGTSGRPSSDPPLSNMNILGAQQFLLFVRNVVHASHYYCHLPDDCTFRTISRLML